MYGTDDNLDDAHLVRMAGRFSRRIRAWCKAHDVPAIDCRKGDRKHKIAEDLLPEVTVESPTYDLTVFKIPFSLLTVKVSTKGERVLRIETIMHNTKVWKCRRSLPEFAPPTPNTNQDAATRSKTNTRESNGNSDSNSNN